MNSCSNTRDDAVSPVVGVMLMLVVTIIIAAVVSAFSGGLTAGKEKAPQIAVQGKIINDGTWGGSNVDFFVTGAEPGVPTKDIKIVTEWTAQDGTKGGSTIIGPNTTCPANTHYGGSSATASGVACSNAPYGFGPGVNQSVTTSSMGPGGNSFYPDQLYGNYTLKAGTQMHNGPCANYGRTPDTRFLYSASAGAWDWDTDQDGMQAILGKEWYKLRAGDTVRVKFVHVPTGSIIYDGKIIVEGS